MGASRERLGHDAAVHDLRARLAALPPGSPVRLAKPTSNLFRFRDPDAGPGLDVSAFHGVLSVDPARRTAEVGGMTTYEDLVARTLPYGLMPAVVPQLKTITLGGAVAGLGIESTSFHSGLVHESVLEMEILTGDGRVLLARPDNEHRDLFFGFPNSYGTLGYALRLEIELRPVKPYVHIRHLRHGDAAETAAAVESLCANGFDGQPVDFLDGTVFGPDEHYLTIGTFTDTAPATSDYTGEQVYYRSIPRRADDHLTVHDYLWRWDPDWFWCSRAFGAQHPLVRRLWPKRYRRSDVYRRLVAFDRRHRLSARIDRLRRAPEHEPVIQDIEVPVDALPKFLDFFHREVGISPVWLCPLRQADDRAWPLYPLRPDTLYVNVGFWATVPLRPGQSDGHHNRLIERVVTELGGHKSLYSNSFYDREEFDRLYDGEHYRRLKQTYDGNGRLPDLYDKCVRAR
ncbi:FAD/FMN-containing dehydrogenase [Herbihabitans rhizosphaerae]|uniref:Delta(24)-sterol reductase n=1 Tax=Herbihabitans rhizosphaerae TaxID=1872711 RepID=A0A4Q7KK05_9PSEU|nr:FAD-binding oxidoreductase [Herbihabitans rhizosphaerae]RZS36537.1 FAD/FMN-containing dehydrogenase [Herbihabitans rhizosphaerae]